MDYETAFWQFVWLHPGTIGRSHKLMFGNCVGIAARDLAKEVHRIFLLLRLHLDYEKNSASAGRDFHGRVRCVPILASGVWKRNYDNF